MLQIYHMKLSDGGECHFKASSAGEACYKAIDRYRGCTVLSCWSGGYAPHPRQFGSGGKMEFDVPPHKALPPKPEAEDE